MMKKIILVLVLLLSLSGCFYDFGGETKPDDRYLNMIELISGNDNFSSSSSFYNIATDIAKTNDGYRFYVILDKPRIALYDVKIIAVEEGVDHNKTMAANIGIFEDGQYNMIPNQTCIEKGYVEGLVASAVTDNPNPVLYVLVQWKNKDLSITHREFIKLQVSTEEN